MIYSNETMVEQRIGNCTMQMYALKQQQLQSNRVETKKTKRIGSSRLPYYLYHSLSLPHPLNNALRAASSGVKKCTVEG